MKSLELKLIAFNEKPFWKLYNVSLYDLSIDGKKLVKHGTVKFFNDDSSSYFILTFLDERLRIEKRTRTSGAKSFAEAKQLFRKRFDSSVQIINVDETLMKEKYW